LKEINSRKATNSNDYPAWISKLCCEDICTPLTDIINQMFKERHFPDKWKAAEVVPLLKTNSPSQCSDYRPISLLWHLGKIAEFFINKRLKSQMLCKLQPNQYAYLTGIGCTDAIVAAIDDWTCALDDSKNIGVQAILYDFSKAFDKMQPDILLGKLLQMDITADIITLIKDYLSNREQSVVIRGTGAKSEISKMPVGVPQGTLCSPILWIAFVDSLQFSHGSIIKYADDTTWYYPISNYDNVLLESTVSSVTFKASDVAQKSVEECYDWSRNNHMTLNVKKTKILNISVKKELTMENNIMLNNVAIEITQEASFLGVAMDCHLNFVTHVTNIVKRANKKLFALLVLKRQGVNATSLVKMYQSQVIPVITYGAPGWHPIISQTSCDQLESVQKRALKMIYPEANDYSSRLALARLCPLSQVFHDLCAKYVNKVKTNSKHKLYSRLPKTQSQLGRRHSSRLVDKPVCTSRTKLREKTLFMKFC
jgi:hypothetical protein